MRRRQVLVPWTWNKIIILRASQKRTPQSTKGSDVDDTAPHCHRMWRSSSRQTQFLPPSQRSSQPPDFAVAKSTESRFHMSYSGRLRSVDWLVHVWLCSTYARGSTVLAMEISIPSCCWLGARCSSAQAHNRAGPPMRASSLAGKRKPTLAHTTSCSCNLSNRRTRARRLWGF